MLRLLDKKLSKNRALLFKKGICNLGAIYFHSKVYKYGKNELAELFPPESAFGYSIKQCIIL